MIYVGLYRQPAVTSSKHIISNNEWKPRCQAIKNSCTYIILLLVPKIIRLLTLKHFLKVPDQLGIWYKHNFPSNEHLYFTFLREVKGTHCSVWVRLFKYHMSARVQATPEFGQGDKKTEGKKKFWGRGVERYGYPQINNKSNHSYPST